MARKIRTNRTITVALATPFALFAVGAAAVMLAPPMIGFLVALVMAVALGYRLSTPKSH